MIVQDVSARVRSFIIDVFSDRNAVIVLVVNIACNRVANHDCRRQSIDVKFVPISVTDGCFEILVLEVIELALTWHFVRLVRHHFIIHERFMQLSIVHRNTFFILFIFKLIDKLIVIAAHICRDTIVKHVEFLR